MTVWALADLHLSFGVKNKDMGVFGEAWEGHAGKIREAWEQVVGEEDLVLVAGDISWALKMEDALIDLEWIDSLPGTKVMIKGNHDLWWKVASKVRAILPKSIHVLNYDAYVWEGVDGEPLVIGGTRLWERPGIEYGPYITFKEPPPGVNVTRKEESEEERAHDAKTYANELVRLQRSLDAMAQHEGQKVVMVHYPPIPPDGSDTEVTRMLEKAGVEICLYGHLHNLKKGAPVNQEKNGIRYICTACDWLNFVPLKILP